MLFWMRNGEEGGGRKDDGYCITFFLQLSFLFKFSFLYSSIRFLESVLLLFLLM